MKWKVAEESILVRSLELAEIHNTLRSKIGLKNLLQLARKFGCEENNIWSFQSCTSSNIDRKFLSLNKSAIFEELLFKLMHKNREEKLKKIK